MTLEIVLVMLQNLKVASVLLSMLLIFVALVSAAFYYIEYDTYPKALQVHQALRVHLSYLIPIFVLISLTPTVDDIVHVRIELIKLHLSNPENVQKGVETIERIAKELECKYLTKCILHGGAK